MCDLFCKHGMNVNTRTKQRTRAKRNEKWDVFSFKKFNIYIRKPH